MSGLLIGAMMVMMVGCASSRADHSYSPPAEYGTASTVADYGGSDEVMVQAESEPVSSRRSIFARTDSDQGQQPQRGEQASSVEGDFDSQQIDGNLTQPDGSRPDTTPEPDVEEEPSRGQLLIYTGQITLAIYDVQATQETAVQMVEEMEGYISQRTSHQIVARIPAADFRRALDDLRELGDVIDLNWQAQDVSEEVRDLDIRLRNSLQLRDRLEALLDEVESVEDALQIEQQLERVTLEVERIRGQLLSFEDRIAYSTITLSFRAKNVVQVPDADFLLPYQWLHQLGLETLLRAPEVRR